MSTSMPDEPVLHIVLFEPEIPQNTGNIGRTCVAVDAKLWLVRPLGFRLDERHLRRAGMDYWQHLDWEIVADWDTLQQRLPGRPDVADDQDRAALLHHGGFRTRGRARFRQRIARAAAVVAAGDPQRCLRIPMREEARSLNLACSVAVAAYEALRQIQAGTE
jgi:tRNA (cytidine/uridine-2'-O-)-methyltransferase